MRVCSQLLPPCEAGGLRVSGTWPSPAPSSRRLGGRGYPRVETTSDKLHYVNLASCAKLLSLLALRYPGPSHSHFVLRLGLFIPLAGRLIPHSLVISHLRCFTDIQGYLLIEFTMSAQRKAVSPFVTGSLV